MVRAWYRAYLGSNSYLLIVSLSALIQGLYALSLSSFISFVFMAIYIHFLYRKNGEFYPSSKKVLVASAIFGGLNIAIGNAMGGLPMSLFETAPPSNWYYLVLLVIPLVMWKNSLHEKSTKSL